MSGIRRWNRSCFYCIMANSKHALKKFSEAMVSAAPRIGRIHAQKAWAQNSPPLPFLPRQGACQYPWGAQRAVLLSKHLRYHGLAPLIEPYQQQFVPSLATDNSIIHRDYFPPNNIMVQRRVVMPIDRGANCIAVREIDLAALTFGWPDEIEHECQKAYVHARWRSGAPDAFPAMLTAAPFYRLFYTVGTKKNGQDEKRMLRCLDKLHERGTSLEQA